MVATTEQQCKLATIKRQPSLPFPFVAKSAASKYSQIAMQHSTFIISFVASVMMASAQLTETNRNPNFFYQYNSPLPMPPPLISIPSQQGIFAYQLQEAIQDVKMELQNQIQTVIEGVKMELNVIIDEAIEGVKMELDNVKTKVEKTKMDVSDLTNQTKNIQISMQYGVSFRRNWQIGDNGLSRWDFNCDFGGYDIGVTNNPSSIDQCRGLCIANPQCTHFSYGHGLCWTKRNTEKWTESATTNTVCGFILGRSGQNL